MRFLADNWWYVLFWGLMGYMMLRGGGCCGGGHSSHNDSHGESHGGGCCGGGHSGHSNHEDNKEHSEVYNDKSINISADTVRDPVCGMIVSKTDSISRVINGEIYYFCSQSCANEFERKYAVR